MPKEEYKINNIAGHMAKMFLNNPLTMIMAVSILLLGYITLQIAPREEDPQIAVSGGSVILIIPGASPEAISNVVIKPLERRIREINPTQIIIVISASNDIQKISESIEIGVNSFIQKPIDTKKIIELLTNVTALISKKKKIETKTFSISLPLDLYELVDENAKSESISKNAVRSP